MDLEEKMEDVLTEQLEKLRGVDIGSKEYKETLDSIVKMHDSIVNKRKIENEYQIKSDENDDSLRLRNEELCWRKKEKTIDVIIALSTFIIALVDKRDLIKSILNFEKDGVIGSFISRSVIGQIFKK